MRYSSEQKQQTRQKMVSAAGETFREHGYNGVGVDGLAKAAGMTSGAFYKHFKSKSEAFHAVLETGLEEVVDGIGEFRNENGEDWWSAFAHFYLGERRNAPLSHSCSMQSLSAEAMRGDDDAKQIFERSFQKIVESTGDDEAKALVSLALLVGGVTLARSVEDKDYADHIAKVVEQEFK